MVTYSQKKLKLKPVFILTNPSNVIEFMQPDEGRERIMNKRRHDKYLQNKRELMNKYKSDGTIVIGNN